MKTTLLLSASLVGLLLSAQTMAATNVATVQASIASTSTPDVQAAPSAEQSAIGPGRYRYSYLAGIFGMQGYVDATGGVARFDNLGGIAVDASGNTYVSEQVMCTIRKISPDGTVSTFAGSAGQSGSQDGAGTAARFNQPSGLAMDGIGNVYVADRGNNTIRKIDPWGNVTTLAGKAGSLGTIDGSKESAQLFNPTFLAVDAAGNVFVTEYKNYAPIAQNPIRKITPDGTVSSLTVSSLDSNYFNPGQICVDPAGNLYVFYYQSGPMEDLADVQKLTPTTVAGNYTASPIASSLDNEFGELSCMSMDETGSLFIYSGWTQSHVHVYTPESGWQDRYPAVPSEDYWMQQFAVGQSGELYFFQNYYTPIGASGGAVGTGVFDPNAAGPVITEQPWLDYTPNNAGAPVPGSTGTFHVGAVGGPGLSYQWYFNSSPINGATSATWVLSNVQKSDEGYYYVVVTDADGSVTSRNAYLTVSEPPSPPSPPAPMPSLATLPTSLPAPQLASPPSAGGGGSLDPRSSLAVLLLLAAKAVRRRAIKGDSVSSQ